MYTASPFPHNCTLPENYIRLLAPHENKHPLKISIPFWLLILKIGINSNCLMHMPPYQRIFRNVQYRFDGYTKFTFLSSYTTTAMCSNAVGLKLKNGKEIFCVCYTIHVLLRHCYDVLITFTYI